MTDLFITHLTHPWGPYGWFDALNSLPVVIFGHFPHVWKLWFSTKIIIFRHIGNEQIQPPLLSLMHQTTQEDPRDDYKQIGHFATWYSKSSDFFLKYIEIAILTLFWVWKIRTPFSGPARDLTQKAKVAKIAHKIWIQGATYLGSNFNQNDSR